ncbi:MAG TPA: carboxypeptidase regulatory-like domain-containing protein [Candidatus Limnocylindria bacterium]|nr:carboxypeptidase regulatory-like domain-containing protein [Candidatus Limnocylindria bacterium]
MRMWKAMLLAVVLAGSLVVVTSANAQTYDRGEIHGFVYDTSHAVVPKAKLTLSNPSTGYKRENTSDSSGAYAFPQILPGIYQMNAEAAGFAAITITDITVNIGASLDLDVTLPVKGQTATVTVSAAAAGPIDTTTAGINQIINQKDLQGLPLNGRDYRDLAQLSPSAEVVPGLRGGIRFGGQISDYSGLVIDGQDAFNNFFGENFGSLETKNFSVPLDSVQEFQVVTNGFAPEFGRATGGLINLVTKSGTNEWHGQAHYYALPDQFETNDFLGTPPNITLRQQFGGSAGFPIHKNTQFFYIATDVQREHGPLTTNFCNGISVAACAANLDPVVGPVFQNCTPATCTAGQVPLLGLPNTVSLPAGCKPNPTAGTSVLQDCYGVANLGGFLGANNQFQNLFTLLGHWDWQMTPANHFSIRGYGTRNHTSGFTGGRGENEVQLGFGNSENFINQGISGVFALNTVMGRKVNEIRVSLSGETRKRHPNQAGVPSVSFSNDGTGPLTFGPAGGGVTIGQRFFLPINNDQGKFEAQDNFEFTWGKHDFKFGGDVNPFVDRKDLFAGWSAGEWDFGSLNDFARNSPALPFIQGFSATPGSPTSALFSAGVLRPAYQTGLGLYWQDKWSLTPKFTLTYGLRWDGTWNPQPQTPFGGTFVPIGSGSGTTTVPVPQKIPNDFGHWGPRVGFAWNLGSTEHPTVVRGAWGLYYAQSPTIFFPQGGGGKTTTCFAPFTTGCPLPGGGFPYLLTATPAGIAGAPSFTSVEPDFQNPRVSNLTAGVEHTLMRNLTVSGSFVYLHSWHLRTGGFDEEVWARNFQVLGTDNVGRSILGPVLDNTLSNGVDMLGSYSHGNYYAFVANVTKKFSNHFQVFANYTWSQNKDNASSERDTDTFFGPQDPRNLGIDYGRNGLDITNQFKAAGVYELPWGLQVSSIFIAHSGTPYPVYINVDVNGDGVSNSGHNNDRPTFMRGGNVALLGRYPLSQPNFFNGDVRLLKDFGFHERYHVQLQGDFFNLTNHGNKYSNPDVTGTIDYTANCAARVAPAVGFSCTPLARSPRVGDPTPGGGTLRQINQIAPGSTPFQFQVGAKFIF